ncbi:MAG: NAD(P)/FAD-dependent oxidoreductase [candidate division KSB1 bacterium]|nr:NAD(P)/FAD-dependent oxidoreductase [candidate division KSB1 bacterium]
MDSYYDVVVVGAGPAGSTAARFAALGGAKVLLLEKDREVGVPVRCAEGVGDQGLRSVLEPREHWIAARIDAAELVAPDGTRVRVHYANGGYVLHRKLFDYDLAQMAAEAGAEVRTKAYVHGLLWEDGRVAGVRVSHLGEDREVRARIVIGADGVESRVGRWAGLNTVTRMHDMEACVQVTVSRADVEPNVCYFYFGKNVAPGGYAWVFPKGNGMANIGLGLSGDYTGIKKPIAYLRQFLESHFPKASVLTLVAGGVPCAATLRKIVADGLMLVGDAAHQANPISGGGIATALIAGRICGRVAAEAIREGDVSEKRLSKYAKEWHEVEGKTHERFYRIKEGVYRLSDEDLNRTAHLLSQLPPEEITVTRVFRTALFKQPRLLLEVAKVFVG